MSDSSLNLVLESNSLTRGAGDQSCVVWSIVDVDDRAQRVLEEVEDSVIGDFLGVFGLVDELALNVVIDSNQGVFGDLGRWLDLFVFRGRSWAYLEATVIHFHQQAVDAA
jgi:hypothetical protein